MNGFVWNQGEGKGVDLTRTERKLKGDELRGVELDGEEMNRVDVNGTQLDLFGWELNSFEAMR